MGFRINNNLAALLARNNLTTHEKGITRSIERLSSGLKINRGSDDPSRLSISEKLSAQITGLNSAITGSQQSISILQTADGALSESNSVLLRMRELAVQSQSASLTTDDRLELQKEVDELVSELDTIASTTKFNDRNILDGSASSRVSTSNSTLRAYQTGKVSPGNYSIDVRLSSVGQGETQKSAIQTLKSSGQVANLNTTLGELTGMFDASGNDILANPQTLYLRADGHSTSITVSNNLSLQQFAANTETAITNSVENSGLGLTGSSFAYDSTTGQLIYESKSAGVSGELTFSGTQDLISALGFSVTSQSIDSSHKITATETGVIEANSYSAHTNINRAIGVLPGLELEFDPTKEARLDGSVAGIETIRIHSSVSDVVFTIHDTNASDNKQADSSITNSVRITLTAGRSYSTSSISEMINTAISVSNDTNHALTTGHSVAPVFQNPAITASFSGYDLSLTSSATGSSSKISIAANSSAQSLLGLSSGAFVGSGGTAAVLTGTTDISSGATFAGASVVRIRVGDGDFNTNQQDSLGNIVDNGSTGTDITFNQGSTITATSIVNSFNTYFTANNVKVSASLNSSGNLLLTSTETGTDSKVSIFAVGGSSISAIGLSSGNSDTGSGGNAAVITGTTTDSAKTVGFQLTRSLRFNLTDGNGVSTGTIHFGTSGINAAQNESFTISKTEITSIMNSTSVGSTDVDYTFDPGNRLDFFSRSSGEGSRVVLSTADATNASRGLSTFGLDFNSAASGSGKTNFSLQVSDQRIGTPVGSNGETIRFDINNVSSKALGLDGIDIASMRSATRSMGKIDEAIDRVVSERSRVGAVENRLYRNINVLTNTATNLEAARSVIRDADVAQETIDFTKSQLLLQSATAQLIQANGLGGNAMSLLE